MTKLKVKSLFKTKEQKSNANTPKRRSRDSLIMEKENNANVSNQKNYNNFMTSPAASDKNTCVQLMAEYTTPAPRRSIAWEDEPNVFKDSGNTFGELLNSPDPLMKPMSVTKNYNNANMPLMYGSNVTMESPDPMSKYHEGPGALKTVLGTPSSSSSSSGITSASSLNSNSPTTPTVMKSQSYTNTSVEAWNRSPTVESEINQRKVIAQPVEPRPPRYQGRSRPHAYFKTKKESEKLEMKTALVQSDFDIKLNRCNRRCNTLCQTLQL